MYTDLIRNLNKKKMELEEKIRKNKKEIEVLDKNLSPIRDIASISSFAAMIIPANHVVLALPINGFFKMLGLVGTFIGADKLSDKFGDKVKDKDDLRKIVHSSNPDINTIAEAKYEREIELQKNLNLQKVISKIENNTQNSKGNPSLESGNLENEKEEMKILSTQKVLKENYNKVKNGSKDKEVFMIGATFGTAAAAIVTAIAGLPIASYALLAGMVGEMYMVSKNRSTLAQKEEILKVNNSLGEHSLTEKELCNENTEELDKSLSKTIEKVVNKMFSYCKGEKISDEKSLEKEDNKEKDINYDYNLLFNYRPMSKEKSKTKSLSLRKN